jgi:hypothetical protein
MARPGILQAGSNSELPPPWQVEPAEGRARCPKKVEPVVRRRWSSLLPEGGARCPQRAGLAANAPSPMRTSGSTFRRTNGVSTATCPVYGYGRTEVASSFSPVISNLRGMLVAKRNHLIFPDAVIRNYRSGVVWSIVSTKRGEHRKKIWSIFCTHPTPVAFSLSSPRACFTAAARRGRQGTGTPFPHEIRTPRCPPSQRLPPYF